MSPACFGKASITAVRAAVCTQNMIIIKDILQMYTTRCKNDATNTARIKRGTMAKNLEADGVSSPREGHCTPS